MEVLWYIVYYCFRHLWYNNLLNVDITALLFCILRHFTMIYYLSNLHLFNISRPYLENKRRHLTTGEKQFEMTGRIQDQTNMLSWGFMQPLLLSTVFWWRLSFYTYSDSCGRPRCGRGENIFKLGSSTLLQLTFSGLTKALVTKTNIFSKLKDSKRTEIYIFTK